MYKVCIQELTLRKFQSDWHFEGQVAAAPITPFLQKNRLKIGAFSGNFQVAGIAELSEGMTYTICTIVKQNYSCQFI